ncbi:MAG: tRNA pseudouridine(55) synthase TruB [Elusimicrobiota bacterium]|jgi:tRNA pseudouridine55 synthase|nr:tRNA pseudouridine(55) synthase TruB [Elusimicrobiota bacterium]
MQDNDFSGMLLLDKPIGIASFKAVYIIRKTLNAKKCGHCGTLDPIASGLLLVLINKAAKLQDKFMKQDKVYSSSFLLGTTTDSLDLSGKIIEQKDFSKIKLDDIKKAIKTFIGEIEQIPPMFSAIKIGGKRLYKLARQGISIERKPRKVKVHNIEILSFAPPILNLRIECSSGTYIRTLSDDLGKVLGCGAVVQGLRREKIGNFDIKDAINQDDFRNIDKIKNKTIPMSSLL